MTPEEQAAYEDYIERLEERRGQQPTYGYCHCVKPEQSLAKATLIEASLAAWIVEGGLPMW